MESTAVDQPSCSIWFIHFGEDGWVKSQATDMHRGELCFIDRSLNSRGVDNETKKAVENVMMSGLTGWMPCYAHGFVVVVAWLNGGARAMRKPCVGAAAAKIKQNSTLLLFLPPSNPRALRRQLPSYLLIIHL